MLGRLWRQIVRVVVVVGCVVAFLLLMEILRAYQTLRGTLGPVAGYVFLGAVGLLVLWLVVRLTGGWRLRRRVLKLPQIDDPETAPLHDLHKYARYLVKYLRRLSTNPLLSEAQRAQTAEAATKLQADGKRCTDRSAFVALIQDAEQEHVQPALAELDELAEQEIRECVFHVMTGVAASLWNAVDVLVVLYRNGRMITRITQIYNSRPALREQAAILLDTMKIVAMIKLASMTANLLTKGRRAVPVIGRATESLAQAVGAGVLTSAAGHTAKLRCRAFRGWDRAEAQRHLGDMVGQYLKDCWQSASQCVWPIVTQTAGDVTSAAWQKLREGFGAAVDATAEAADTFVRQPVTSGAEAVANSGRSVFTRARRAIRRTFRRPS